MAVSMSCVDNGEQILKGGERNRDDRLACGLQCAVEQRRLSMLDLTWLGRLVAGASAQ